MGLEWFEYYEIIKNFGDLQNKIQSLKEEVNTLKKEIEKLKKDK